MINIPKSKSKMQWATPQQLAGLSRRQGRGDPPCVMTCPRQARPGIGILHSTSRKLMTKPTKIVLWF